MGRVYNFLNRYLIIFDRKAINCVTSFSKIQINFGQIFVSFTKSIRFKVIITKCSLIYLRFKLVIPTKSVHFGSQDKSPCVTLPWESSLPYPEGPSFLPLLKYLQGPEVKYPRPTHYRQPLVFYHHLQPM